MSLVTTFRFGFGCCSFFTCLMYYSFRFSFSAEPDFMWFFFPTTIAEMICGAKSHSALEQVSGSWQLDSSSTVITADSTSCKTGKKTKLRITWVFEYLRKVLVHGIFYSKYAFAFKYIKINTPTEIFRLKNLKHYDCKDFKENVNSEIIE